METTDFMAVYKDPMVKTFIHRAARRRSKHDPQFWDDLVSEGWIGISLADGGKTHAFYCRCAFRAVENAYLRNWRSERKEDEVLRRILEQIEERETSRTQ